MEIEFLDDLENKVQTLISAIESVRQENSKLKQDFEENRNKCSLIESENEQLTKELHVLKSETSNQQQNLEAATERIQSIIARLESIQ